MVIVLLWLGLVCCGVANGLIYDHVETFQGYYYMMIPSMVAVILLIVHRIYTRNWYGPTGKGNPHHPSIFGGSAAISFIVGFASIFAVRTGEVSWGFIIALVTMFMAFGIASLREMQLWLRIISGPYWVANFF